MYTNFEGKKSTIASVGQVYTGDLIMQNYKSKNNFNNLEESEIQDKIPYLTKFVPDIQPT